MGNKKLQLDSAFDKFDTNNDEVVDDEEMSKAQQLIEIDNKDKKEDQQRRLAWIAMISMVIFTAVLFSPIISPEKVAALSDLLGMFYIAQAGVVAAFFGTAAYMTVNR